EDVDREELKKLLELHSYICNNCGTEFDEAKMGILFKDLPPDWKCPNCNCSKKEFKIKKSR
ncbi:MAG: rubredoxin, partial [Promethearchaeota archaeon]